jgi:putative membrane protein
MKTLTVIASALLLAPALARADSTVRTDTKHAERTAGNPMNTPDTDSAKAPKEKLTDARLVTLLQHVNKDEIDAGRLAEKNGQSPEIQNFGKKLVADHTRSQNEVGAAAKKAGISPGESALTTHDREMMKIDKNKMDELKKMSGANFDKAFATVMANDHKHMISLLKDGKGDLRSDDLKTLVDNTLPVLEQHKDMAEDASSKLQRATNQGRAPRAIDRSSNPAKPDDTARSGAPDKR